MEESWVAAERVPPWTDQPDVPDSKSLFRSLLATQALAVGGVLVVGEEEVVVGVLGSGVDVGGADVVTGGEDDEVLGSCEVVDVVGGVVCTGSEENNDDDEVVVKTSSVEVELLVTGAADVCSSKLVDVDVVVSGAPVDPVTGPSVPDVVSVVVDTSGLLVVIGSVGCG